MREVLLGAAFCALAVLGGCALSLKEASWAESLPPRDAAAIAEIVAAIAADRTAPEDGAIALVPAHQDDDPGGLGDAIGKALRQRGYTVRSETPAARTGARLRFFVVAYAGGYLLRVLIKDAEASTHLARQPDGQLAPAAPLTVKETAR
jgi:hypothetical protein